MAYAQQPHPLRRAVWALEKRRIPLQWLTEHPSAGMPRPDIKPGYFCFPAGRHLIFYQQRAEGIKVIGILHQNMDYLVHFDNEP